MIPYEFCKISDFDIPNTNLIGTKLVIRNRATGETQLEEYTEELYNEDVDNGDINNDYAFFGTITPIIIIHSENVEYDCWTFPEKGVYVDNNEYRYISQIYKAATTEEIVHKIDEKYLPSEVNKDCGSKIELFITEEDAVRGEGETAGAYIYTVGDSRLYVRGAFTPKEPQDANVTYYCRMSDMPDFVTDIVYKKYVFFAANPRDIVFRSTDYPIRLEGFFDEFDANVILRLSCDFINSDSSSIFCDVTELLPSYSPR